MTWYDWLILLIPLAFVMFMGFYSRRYIRGVTDFLAAGRICGRYVISVADVANGLAVITLVASVEVQYKTGFAVAFWNSVITPLSIVLSLTGYCIYRFRETKSLSLGQFLEMRYNRPFRIFAAGLRSIAEMLANMICPALAARFFIYFLDLPHKIDLFGFSIPTFSLVVLIVLALAISIIWLGGALALVITDTIQGLFCYPMLVVFCVFVLVKFSWFDEIVPVMMDRVPGESFLNPFDISELRDFNLFALIVTITATLLHRASWLGGGNSSAAKSPHEQKMASVLGTWRGGFGAIFYVLLAVMILTVLNHQDFASEGKAVRTAISSRVIEELVDNPQQRAKLLTDIEAIPEQHHMIGQDRPLSQKRNLDTAYFDVVLKDLNANDKEQSGAGKQMFQEFRTLFNQLMLPMTMRHLLPSGLMGLFALLMVLMMISTDDTRIYSASSTLTQDVIMPLRKKAFTPEEHIKVLRWVSVGVGVFFLIGSTFMAQLDYINLFITIMCSMWLGGCGPVMVFGLYSRFGTTAGAFASLISGMVLSLGGIIAQRNWADLIYPWLARHQLVDIVGKVLETLSAPFEPYVVWRMDAIKFPINSYEIYFLTMVFSLLLYCVVSFLTCKEPFNLDRMLHRGIYNVDGEDKHREKLTVRNAFVQLIGITPEYTRGDRIIAWSVFIYSFVYRFGIAFLLVAVWNVFSPWQLSWWGHYFFITSLLIPALVAAVSTVWFSIGGVIDLRRLFRDLKNRVNDPLDNGQVEGHTSLSDQKIFAEREKQAKQK